MKTQVGPGGTSHVKWVLIFRGKWEKVASGLAYAMLSHGSGLKDMKIMMEKETEFPCAASEVL